ncbi:uncharacterized protein [Nicotiana tomentosiformis]|uniref:uncharacterized protein n=1 Tax=Nicotiana tomentosiformis TaxID=4098 RepID=UPI00388CE9B5
MSDEEQNRLERFGRLKPPTFNGTESQNDQDFLDRCQRMFRTAAFRWWQAYERSRPADAAPLSLHEFSIFFLEKFVPLNRREKLCRQFEQLHHEENASGARFDEVVDIARRLELVFSQEREERESKKPRGSGGFSGVPFWGSPTTVGVILIYPLRWLVRFILVHYLATVHTVLARGSHISVLSQAQSSSRAPSVQSSSAPGFSIGYSGSRGLIQSPPPLKDRGYYECGELGHIRRDCPHLLGGLVQQRGRATTSAPVTSPHCVARSG